MSAYLRGTTSGDREYQPTRRRIAGKRLSHSQADRAIFTIVSRNYISYAATLMQSVRVHHPDASRYIVLADAHGEFPDVDLAAQVVSCDEMGIELVDNMKLWYTVLEFNTAIKPYAFRWLIEHCGHKEIVFLDPDILLLQPMTHAFEALKKHNIILTPHITRSLQDGKEPSDLSIMKSGVFNLGFLAVRNDAPARELISWWCDRCYLHCRVDIMGHMFTDQRWMDLAHVFVPKPLVLRHPGYNVAYWNVAHRRITLSDDYTWLCDGRKLVFYHFSGIDPANPTVISKHQDRLNIDNIGCVARLYETYRQLIVANGWERYSKVPYAFGNLADGRLLGDPMRFWLRRAVDEGRLCADVPLTIESDYFDRPDEELAARGIFLTRFMYQYWLGREDLQRAFNIFTPDGYAHYIKWIVDGEPRRQGVDERSILAAINVSERVGVSARATISFNPEPPWPSLSRLSSERPAREVGSFLSGDLFVQFKNTRACIPIQIGLLWELRDDLRQHFQPDTVDGLDRLISWALTDGVKEGIIDGTSLSDGFVEYLCEISPLTEYYREMPITRGLIATSSAQCENHHYEMRRRFPVEEKGRLSHGLWFAFVGSRRFLWPPSLSAPLVAYFQAAGTISYDGVQLPLAVQAVWELRQDIQELHPLDTEEDVRDYLAWLLSFGLKEMEITVDQLGSSFRDFLTEESPRLPGFERVYEIVYNTRHDLQEVFDLNLESSRQSFKRWCAVYASDPDAEPATSIVLGANPDQRAMQSIHKVTVALTGEWAAPTGRGEDVRCSVKALLEVGFIDFVIIDLPSGEILSHNGSKLPPGRITEVRVNIVHLNAQTAYPDWRRLRSLGVVAEISVGFWAWELETLPSYWRHAFSFYDEIWAATKFARKAFAREKARPVRLMPMAVIGPTELETYTRQDLSLPERATIFLFVFDFGSFADRKNPIAVVKAFLKAFPSGKEFARLVIKTMNGDRYQKDLIQLIATCSDPRILIRNAKIERRELLGLIQASDAFVSLHRSEGFGRGPAEAMLLGKPVIVTGYSGPSDFVTERSAYIVDYQLVPVVPGQYPGVEQQRWADPNVETAALMMRKIYDHPDDARRVGRLGSARIKRLFGPRVIGHKMCLAINDIISRYAGTTDSDGNQSC